MVRVCLARSQLTFSSALGVTLHDRFPIRVPHFLLLPSRPFSLSSPPCLPHASLKYDFTDEFHDELWHLGAETGLMSDNYQDVELANGLSPSFVSS